MGYTSDKALCDLNPWSRPADQERSQEPWLRGSAHPAASRTVPSVTQAVLCVRSLRRREGPYV